MTAVSDSRDNLYAKLNAETGILAWSDVAPHFARGAVIRVGTELDLVRVATSMAEDDAGQLSGWFDRGLVRRASDSDAIEWSRDPDVRLWAVVVAPWVLVQNTAGGSARAGYSSDEGTDPSQRGSG
jgi:hypothetical protein